MGVPLHIHAGTDPSAEAHAPLLTTIAAIRIHRHSRGEGDRENSMNRECAVSIRSFRRRKASVRELWMAIAAANPRESVPTCDICGRILHSEKARPRVRGAHCDHAQSWARAQNPPRAGLPTTGLRPSLGVGSVSGFPEVEPQINTDKHNTDEEKR